MAAVQPNPVLKAGSVERAAALKERAAKAGVGLIYKTSFDKANRTSMAGQRGLGLMESLPIFADIRSTFGLPVLTDIHEKEQCAIAAQAVDILQIPAFLSRQTDLILAAAATGAIVNVKKGQFLAPWDMQNVLDKITGAGNLNVLLTERGASFGYNTLVVDMTGLPQMARMGAPIVMDATHAVQKPGGQGASSGGNRDMAPYIARAAVAVGVAAVFIEVHEDPERATREGRSDGPNMLFLKDVPALLGDLVDIDRIAKRPHLN